MPTLIIQTPKGEEECTFDGRLVVGRHPGTGLTLDDPKVSRQHAAIEPYGTQWKLVDLASSNGTFVDDKRLRGSVVLADGDRFRLASTTLVFRLDDSKKTQAVSVNDFEFGVLESIEAGDGGLASAIEGSDAAALERMRRHLQMMYEIAAASSETLDEELLLDIAVAKLFHFFPQSGHVLLLFLEDDGEFRVVRSCDRSGSADAVMSRTLARQVVDTRRGLLSLDVSHDARIEQSKSISAMLLRSIACVPVIARQKVLGVLQVSAFIDRPPFCADDLSLLVGVAAQIGTAIANARMHRVSLAQEMVQEDLALARRIQARFLPQSGPQIDGYLFASEYSAALEVGGDYYDFISLDDGRVVIAVGDVSGKGMSGALYMARLSAETRFQATSARTPAEIVTRLNAAMCRELEEGMFVTMLFVVLDPRLHTIEVVNCGHPEPLIRSAQGAVTRLSVKRQVPIGVLDSFTYGSAPFDVREGDTVVLFTDGITEAMDVHEKGFGTDRLVAALQEGTGSATELCERVMEALDRYVGEVAQHDDITLVCFGRA